MAGPNTATRARAPTAERSAPVDDIIFEFTPYGAVMRVTAMDPRTLTEITIQGPANADHRILQEMARRRLVFVLERRQKEGPMR